MKRAIPFVVGLIVFAGLILLVVPRGSQSVVRVSHANPKLQAASRAAQEALPTFIERVRAAKPGERFAIRAAFPSSMGPEYLWVRDVTLEGDAFGGIVDQEPIAARSTHRGDHVTIKRADVYDWMIKGPDGVEGGETERALSEANRP